MTLSLKKVTPYPKRVFFFLLMEEKLSRQNDSIYAKHTVINISLVRGLRYFIIVGEIKPKTIVIVLFRINII